MKTENGFSIIIPTFQEAKNIPQLIERIANVNFNNRPFEVLLIDDNSQDGTVEIVDDLCQKYSWLKLIVRQQKQNLSLSVFAGFDRAHYPILITIDADLSHPPEKIPEILHILDEEKVDMILGSRYMPGGSTDEVWPITRKIGSYLAAQLARIILQCNLTDPLSGFVAIRKSTYQARDQLDIIGWKWGLELIMKCHCYAIREIPIHFSQRQKGYSKLNIKIALNYLQHLFRLWKYRSFS